MKLISVDDIATLTSRVGLHAFFKQLIDALIVDFKRWPAFAKSPRLASHVPGGVIELMPTHDDAFYTFKYVNGHPKNTKHNKLSVVALGVLASIEDGHPLLLSEMTLLTAFRTAATSAMVAKYLAKKNSKVLTLIGTGAQAAFQTLAFDSVFALDEVRFFDIDPKAMERFKSEMSSYAFRLTPCSSIKEAIRTADIITTATAAKERQKILTVDMIEPGVLINAIGGDCPGKTELDPALLQQYPVVVEYLPQTLVEGEIQHADASVVYGECWEIISGKKPGRQHDQEVFIFDSVGFAIEDFSVLRFLYENRERFELGRDINLLPALQDPKALFSLLNREK